MLQSKQKFVQRAIEREGNTWVLEVVIWRRRDVNGDGEKKSKYKVKFILLFVHILNYADNPNPQQSY